MICSFDVQNKEKDLCEEKQKQTLTKENKIQIKEYLEGCEQRCTLFETMVDNGMMKIDDYLDILDKGIQKYINLNKALTLLIQYYKKYPQEKETVKEYTAVSAWLTQCIEIMSEELTVSRNNISQLK